MLSHAEELLQLDSSSSVHNELLNDLLLDFARLSNFVFFLKKIAMPKADPDKIYHKALTA